VWILGEIWGLQVDSIVLVDSALRWRFDYRPPVLKSSPDPSCVPGFAASQSELSQRADINMSPGRAPPGPRRNILHC
jgi:hypothetical protein